MLRKTYRLVMGNDFLRSSAVVFSANMLVGVLNYALVIFAARALGVEYSVWTALSGVYAMLATFNTGLFTEVNKEFGKLAKDSGSVAVAFYDYLMRRSRRVMMGLILISPLIGYILYLTTRISGPGIYTLLVVGVVVSVSAGLNRFLLMGMLHNLKFGVVTVVAGLGRFLPTLLFFELGLGIWALPLGLLVSQGLAYASAALYIRGIRRTLPAAELTPEKRTAIEAGFSLRPYLVASVKSTVVLFFLATFLNIAPVLSERTLAVEEKDLFAVLFNFGQIIHFGSTAFTQAIIVHATRSAGNKIYYFSIGLMTLLTTLIGGLFFFGGEFMLGLFGKSQYADSLPLVLYYSLFIVFYNIVFISVQYLLSHSRYKVLASLPVVCGVLVGTSYAAIAAGQGLGGFINAQIITGALAAVGYAGYIVWWRSQEQAPKAD